MHHLSLSLSIFPSTDDEPKIFGELIGEFIHIYVYILSADIRKMDPGFNIKGLK